MLSEQLCYPTTRLQEKFGNMSSQQLHEDSVIRKARVAELKNKLEYFLYLTVSLSYSLSWRNTHELLWEEAVSSQLQSTTNKEINFATKVYDRS